MSYLDELFSVKGKVALLTGGAGVLAGAVAQGLGKAGVRLVLTDIAPLDERVQELRRQGIEAYGYRMDVLDKADIDRVAQIVQREVGAVDILLSAAGGNMPEASTAPERSFFDLPIEALQQVVNLNLFGGAILPAQVFAKQMLENETGGVIIHFSSMSAFKPLTREGGGEQLHAVAGGAYRSGILPQSACERHRSGLLPHQTEPLPVAGRGRQSHPTRASHHRAYPNGAFREPG